MPNPASAPPASEYASYYARYVALVPVGDVIATLEKQLDDMRDLLAGIPEARADEKHGPYTWSFKQVVGHISDTERIFAYRVLRFGRGDSTPLPGFEQEPYVKNGGFEVRRLADIAAEFDSVRRATLALLRNLDDEAWLRRGTASDNEVSVRALAYVIAGHAQHHLDILQRRRREYIDKV